MNAPSKNPNGKSGVISNGGRSKDNWEVISLMCFNKKNVKSVLQRFDVFAFCKLQYMQKRVSHKYSRLDSTTNFWNKTFTNVIRF